tara:strand:+ start:229 stop:489 length:261 start_codon:yes stop_codon:yes gene_type:complete
MAKKQKEQPVLTLDGKDYFAGELTGEQLRIKDHLADLGNKLNTNVFINEQLTVSREAFINMFRASLEKDDQEEKVEEPVVIETVPN